MNTLTVVLGAAILGAACNRASSDSVAASPFRVVARDFVFDAPDTVPAGAVRLTFHNEGPSYHHVQVVRIARDIPFVAIPDSLSTTGILPDWLIPVGGAEGADSIWRPVTATLRLSPGRYLLLCRITTPTQQLHYKLGMHRALVVVGSDAPTIASIPADTTVRLQDYSVHGPETLRAGLWRFRVYNSGPHEHHVAMARLAAGRSLTDVIGQPPGLSAAFDVLGGTAALAPGQENVLEMELRPGQYVYLCFVLDPATGREHYAMGMVRALAVTP